MRRNFFKRNIAFILICAVAAGTMCYSNIRITRAAGTAPAIKSAVYEGTVSQQQIGVSLYENGVLVASRDNTATDTDNMWVYGGTQTLFDNVPGLDKTIILGKEYDMALQVGNSGNIAEYVRLVIHKYWERVDGEDKQNADKKPDLDPNYIDVHFVNIDDAHWKMDDTWPNASHPETIVLYYNQPLQPGEMTVPATDKLTVDGLTAKSVKTWQEGNITHTVYDYDGVQLALEAEVDAVQTHSAHDALVSAWGADPWNKTDKEADYVPQQDHDADPEQHTDPEQDVDPERDRDPEQDVDPVHDHDPEHDVDPIHDHDPLHDHDTDPEGDHDVDPEQENGKNRMRQGDFPDL